ncbi:hypothetical protein OG799_09905 [Micromonospora sp. NBC_00898]|uniref:hypothetical protein n=1 Tax=Micromonospora sp. NBC_00898 TaxID=2975981 RepID=UPI00386F9600|nr:hypothetical protein OG799_09905 [Micromonospora sp. NBC_00898]
MGRAAAASVAVLLAVTVAGCAAEGRLGLRVSGCTAPAHEDELLDAYAADPVLAVTPAGARRVRDVVRSHGCHRISREDASNTSVSLSWRSDRDHGEAELRRTFDPAARDAGWRYTEVPDQPPTIDGGGFLSWCRSVRDVPSRLVVRSDPAQRVDVRPSTADRSPSPRWSVASPSGIYLIVYADPTCLAS